MHQKQITRYRRAKRARAKMRELGAHRLAVHRTPRHIYAQIIAPDGDRTIAAASTLQEDVRAGLSATGNVAAATAVGKAIAEKAKAAGVENVAFDRSGFAYHGRISALADAARDAGLKF